LKILLDGYRRFRKEVWPAEHGRYEQLARWGQHPQTLVVACSDSRVDPQTVFGAVPGELFVARNIGGLIPPYQPDGHYHGTSAVLEYGVRVLKVARIVVLGHAQCGGVRAMVEGSPAEARDFVDPWMQMAKDAIPGLPENTSHDDLLAHYETEIVRLSLVHLKTFPWIAEAVEAGQLDLLGFRFDIHTGVLDELHEEGFVPIT